MAGRASGGPTCSARVAALLGVAHVEAVPVVHCPLSYGYVMAQMQPEPWKLVYVPRAGADPWL